MRRTFRLFSALLLAASLIGGPAMAKSRIKDKADLRGKKIGFTAGTGSEVYTATLLKAAGLTPADVTWIG